MSNHHDPKPLTLLAAALALEPHGETSPHIVARDAEALMRLGKRALRIAEQKCNGITRYDTNARQVLSSWTEQDEASAEKAIAKIKATAAAILASYSATDIKAHGDPRGFVLTFRLASGRSNSFASNVWGV